MKGKGKSKGKKKRIPKETEAAPPAIVAERIGFSCDKCGGVFVTEFELDHHDKIDH